MYILINPNNGSGMGSYIWQTLRCMSLYPGRKCYVHFSNCLYEDHTDVTTNNPFDYYFKQPFKKPKQQDIELVISNDESQMTEYRDVFMADPTPSHIKQVRFHYNSIINDKLQLKPQVLEKINNFYNANLLNKSVLGIHLRGTDHPYKKDIIPHLSRIAEMAEKYDTIFLATDEQRYYDILRGEFNSKLVSYNSIKSITGAPLHGNSLTTGPERKKIGEDVIIETYLLSKCNFLTFTTGSNINYLARAINPTVEHFLL